MQGAVDAGQPAADVHGAAPPLPVVEVLVEVLVVEVPVAPPEPVVVEVLDWLVVAPPPAPPVPGITSVGAFRSEHAPDAIIAE